MLEEIAEEISELVDEIGREVSIVTVTSSGSDTRPTKTETSATFTAIIAKYKDKDVDGMVIQANDKKAYIAASVAILKGNKVVDGSIDYRIEELQLIQPGDDKLLYIAQLRNI